MRSANGVGLFVIQSSHQPCRLPMLMELVFVITGGALGLAATAPMLGAAVALGLTVGVALALGLTVAVALARADALALALARGDSDGDADGRGAEGAGNTGGSTNG